MWVSLELDCPLFRVNWVEVPDAAIWRLGISGNAGTAAGVPPPNVSDKVALSPKVTVSRSRVAVNVAAPSRPAKRPRKQNAKAILCQHKCWRWPLTISLRCNLKLNSQFCSAALPAQVPVAPGEVCRSDFWQRNMDNGPGFSFGRCGTETHLRPPAGSERKVMPGLGMPMPSAFADLLATREPPQLGPGPRAGVEPQASLALKLDKLLRGTNLSRDKQELIRAVVLLWHDHLEAAHAIVQRLESPDGAFVHGILHRREPDYGNAAYWFRRASAHPVFTALGDAANGCLASPAESALRDQLIPGGRWDPFGFIAACEQGAQLSESHPRLKLLREIQRLESNTLLDWLVAG